MEPVTHFLTGACMARSGLNRKTAYATLAMTLAAEAPDLDMLWGFRGPIPVFQHHRGITHTLIGAPFVALVVTGAVWLLDRWLGKRQPIPVRWTLVWVFSLLAALSHILLDWTNNYGVRPFFPFNPRWYALDLVYIVEPVMLTGLLLGLVIPGILGLADREIGGRKELFRGRRWATGALSLTLLVWGVCWGEHARALQLISQTRFGREPVLRMGAEPYPVNPFHWFSVVETADYYQTGSVDTHRDEVETNDGDDMVFKPPVTPAVAEAKRSWIGRVYLDWARFPVVTDQGRANVTASLDLAPGPLDTAVEFRDLRFAYDVLGRSRRGPSPLGAWAYLAPDGAVAAMVMNGRLQR
ncbi:MAG TPA: metal-dependent hydrolase [Acidobacteriaceae bacterium]|nr:metal-dependent hydrolase [Acidobacteriaceae bacterium]